MRINKQIWIGLLASALSAGTITFDPGSPYVISPGMDNFPTRGDEMGGMVVTATYASGDVVSAVWAPDGTLYGGAARVVDRFWVRQAEDTWGFLGGPWFVKNEWGGNPLQKLVFDGVPGGIIFDRTFVDTDPGGAFGTPGSAQGYTLTHVQGLYDYDVVYRNLARVEGEAPYGDLYTQLELNFKPGGQAWNNGMPSGGFIQFNADTDEIPPGARMLPDTPRVNTPEPSTAALGLTGIAAILLAARRRVA